MSKLRTTASTAIAAIAISSGSLALAAPSAHAQVPGGDSAAQTTRTVQTTRTAVATERPARAASPLVFGQRHEAIRQLQRQLTAAGYPVPATGYFGTITRGALSDLQRDHGLVVTGRATARTLSLLGSEASTLSSNTRTVSVTSSTARTAVVASSNAAQAAVDFAYSQLGAPYRYGGTGAGGYDCSGLTQAAWRAAGVSIPRTSYAQWASLPKVSTSNLQPGDLVIFYGGGHIGIYVGDGQVIHAPRPGKTVEKVSMSTMPVSGAVRPA